jgi:FG-GAP-like repeat
MQQRMWRAGQPIVRTALCAVLPAALWGCSPDLALGDVSAQEQALDQAPMAEPSATASEPTGSALTDPSPAPRPDFTLAAPLPPPEVTMRLDVPGGGDVLTSGVGDLDGDGFADFAAQGWDYDHGTEFVHIRYGGPRPTSQREQFVLEQSGARLIVGPFTDAMLAALLPAGDVDGDGFDDLLIGLGTCDSPQAGEGAYLLYGGPERLSGAQRFDEVGVLLRTPREPDPASDFTSCYVEMDSRVAALGDFDGDGFDDFVLSEAQTLADGAPGKVYLFHGSAQRLRNGTSWLEADVIFQAPPNSIPTATGDVNADGTGDLLLSKLDGDVDRGSILIAGRSTRWQGDVAAASAGTSIGPLFPFTATGTLFLEPASNPILLSPPDVDGDGVADLLLWGDAGNQLFYGEPGLFADGANVPQGILLDNDAGSAADLWFAGDRDGDGDAELVTRFSTDNPLFSNVAFSSGSRQRASGTLYFPAQAVIQANPEGFLHEPSRFLERITLAGDLDGDGISDLLTTSSRFTSLDEGEPTEGSGTSFLFDQPKLHIHYGLPGNAAAPVH